MRNHVSYLPGPGLALLALQAVFAGAKAASNSSGHDGGSGIAFQQEHVHAGWDPEAHPTSTCVVLTGSALQGGAECMERGLSPDTRCMPLLTTQAHLGLWQHMRGHCSLSIFCVCAVLQAHRGQGACAGGDPGPLWALPTRQHLRGTRARHHTSLWRAGAPSLAAAAWHSRCVTCRSQSMQTAYVLMPMGFPQLGGVCGAAWLIVWHTSKAAG